MSEVITTTENPGEEKIPAILEEVKTPNREPQPETPSSSIQPPPLHCFAGPETCDECRKAEEAEKRRLDEEEAKRNEKSQPTGQNGGLEAQNAPVSEEKRKEDQERTRIKKEMFLEALAKTLGDITDACKIIEINKKTYYEWMREDERFKDAVRQVHVEAIDDVKSIAIKLVRRAHPPTVRWWLQCKTEEFKPKSAVEVTPGNAVVFEDMSQPNDDETTRESEIQIPLPAED